MIGLAIGSFVLGSLILITTSVSRSMSNASTVASEISDLEDTVRELNRHSVCSKNFTGLTPTPCTFDQNGAVTGGGAVVADLLRSDNSSMRPPLLKEDGAGLRLCAHPELPDYVFNLVMNYKEGSAGNRKLKGSTLSVNASFDSAGKILDCGINVAASPTVTCPAPPAASGCSGRITFAGNFQVLDTFGGGSAEKSCTPLVGAGTSIPIPALSPGQTVTITGMPPYPTSTLAISTWDGPDCDRSFFFGSITLTCNASNSLEFSVGDIRYYSGRIDENIYIPRATFPASGCAKTSPTEFTCAGNDPLGRITVLPGFAIRHDP